MGTMGLVLPYSHGVASHEAFRQGASSLGTSELGLRHRIAPAPCRRERRVEPFQNRPAVDSAADPIRGEDSALAAACLAGDMHAYERLYALHGAKMKNLARNLLGNALDAEDAVQETFLKVQRSIGGFRGQSSFVTWTFRILVNTCHDARRSRVRKREVTADDIEENPIPEQRAAAAHPTLRLALERALATLTQHQRDVFLLYEVEGFSHAEIGATLDISEAASKNTLFQAKKNLRQMLEPPRSADAAGAR
jgi:RNA polymerase sigma-70 factor (ECF subfamily)